MKTAFNSTLAMSDVFRAFAGCAESMHDVMSNVVYTAAYHVALANNKTQFNKLAEDARMYGGDDAATMKAIKATLGAAKVTPAVKHFRKTYFALSVALDQCGVPAYMPEVPQGKINAAKQLEMIGPVAQAYADEFVSIFTVTLAMPDKTQAEIDEAAAKRAATKAEKEALAAKQAADDEATLAERIESEARTLAESIASAPAAPSLADMARAVLAALQSGALDAEIEGELIAAANVRETAALLALQSSAISEPETV